MTATAEKTKKAIPAQSNGQADDTTPQSMVSFPIRDYTTEKGFYRVHVDTIGSYLTKLGVLKEGVLDLAGIPKSEVQRALIAIGAKNEKDEMLYEAMRGVGLPTLVAYKSGDEYEVLDGLQRTHVITLCAIGLQLISKDPNTTAFSAEFGRNVKTADHPNRVQVERMEFTDYLNHYITWQEWEDLTPEEKAHKFLKLNAGQQKVSASHLAEISLKGERELFTSWGLPTITEKEKKEAPKVKTTTKGDGTPPPVKKYPLDMLLLNLCGYATIQNNPDKKAPFSAGMSEKIREALEKFGDHNVSADFKWLYEDLFPALRGHYENEFPGLKKDSDMFGTPILAALAYARSNEITEEEIDDRKAELIERLLDGNQNDPLTMAGTSRFSWKQLVKHDDMKGSDGVRSRKLTYQGFKLFFLKGSQKTGLPLSWQDAKNEATSNQ